ncbi:MAG TPA: trypsin-like peptidase domain-containing protein [Aliidongia sp.]|uniref:trypsin-like peptidase domain-containing protein n=1 Tax=Aliidongia sp. TaxID=1914230 RepID=UPI002DDD767D|nr:trypsin-like peptidase domain-containing protein [Aliidongia sp.]HEV2674855.1 trypsin-like peptidase domain-containing protein [Aliidongia sp.]
MSLRAVGKFVLILAVGLTAACQAAAQQGSLADAREAIRAKDYGRAIAILQPLAEQGNSAAEQELGGIYFLGLGTPVDANAALKWFMGPAQKGDAIAQKDVAIVYQSGKLGPNDDEAFRWFKLSAEQGNADAESNLGFMYRRGRGTPPDVKEAIRWTIKAAEQGHAVSLANLGTHYAEGLGVAQSYSQALFWLDVAIQRMPPNGPERPKHQKYADGLAAHLSATEVQSIAASATTWIPARGALDSVLAQAGLPPNGPGPSPVRIASAATPAPQAPGGRPPSGSGSGSGFIFNTAGEVLTNNHVVDRCTSIRTRLANGEPTAATLIVTDKIGDLAVLRPAVRLGEPVALRDKAARQGETVIVAGFPLSGLLTTDMNISEGIVSALSGLADSARQIQISAPIQSGNSGGPVFDADGAVVGVVQSALNTAALAAAGTIAQNANFAIKASSVREFLDAKAIPYETTAAGKTHGRVPEHARRSTVFIECLR